MSSFAKCFRHLSDYGNLMNWHEEVRSKREMVGLSPLLSTETVQSELKKGKEIQPSYNLDCISES